MDVHSTNYTLCAMEPVIGAEDRIFSNIKVTPDYKNILLFIENLKLKPTTMPAQQGQRIKINAFWLRHGYHYEKTKWIMAHIKWLKQLDVPDLYRESLDGYMASQSTNQKSLHNRWWNRKMTFHIILVFICMGEFFYILHILRCLITYTPFCLSNLLWISPNITYSSLFANKISLNNF